ncbi:MAG: GNAT family N-acetyltransferase [Thermodesulfobacteriota bacterium]
MKNISFELATEDDLKELTSISIKSFHSDIKIGADILKGPPGYNSLEFHKKMLKKAYAFYKITTNGSIVGAFWFMKEENNTAYLYRIFVNPDCHRQGIGEKAFGFLFNTFPEIKNWELKTPKWNKRTPKFYNKVGFKITREDERFNYFGKRIE